MIKAPVSMWIFQNLKTKLLMIKKISFISIFSAFILASCVTVNVNFPEGAVQQATDNYVKDLYRAKEKAEEQSDKEKDSFNQKTHQINSKSSLAFMLIQNIMLPKAHAQVLNTNTATAKKIMSAQIGRLSEIDKYKKRGIFGEAENGYLTIRNKSFSQIEGKKISKLMNKENEDRKELYKEIANVNNTQIAQIIKSFSKSFQGSSPKGTWIEEGGKWTQK